MEIYVNVLNIKNNCNFIIFFFGITKTICTFDITKVNFIVLFITFLENNIAFKIKIKCSYKLLMFKKESLVIDLFVNNLKSFNNLI